MARILHQSLLLEYVTKMNVCLKEPILQAVCKWLFSEEIVGAKIICATDSKFMSVTVLKCNIRLIDSFNCMIMSLAIMTKTFGETELAEGLYTQ